MSAFAREMVRQRAKYRESLPGRMEAIDRAWDEASLERWEPGPGLEALHRHVHSLAGSAATFDAASVGDAAAPLRALLRDLLEEGRPSAVQLEQLWAYREALREEIGRFLGEGVSGT